MHQANCESKGSITLYFKHRLLITEENRSQSTQPLCLWLICRRACGLQKSWGDRIKPSCSASYRSCTCETVNTNTLFWRCRGWEMNQWMKSQLASQGWEAELGCSGRAGSCLRSQHLQGRDRDPRPIWLTSVGSVKDRVLINKVASYQGSHQTPISASMNTHISMHAYAPCTHIHVK